MSKIKKNWPKLNCKIRLQKKVYIPDDLGGRDLQWVYTDDHEYWADIQPVGARYHLNYYDRVLPNPKMYDVIMEDNPSIYVSDKIIWNQITMAPWEPIGDEHRSESDAKSHQSLFSHPAEIHPILKDRAAQDEGMASDDSDRYDDDRSHQNRVKSVSAGRKSEIVEDDTESDGRENASNHLSRQELLYMCSPQRLKYPVPGRIEYVQIRVLTWQTGETRKKSKN